MFRRKDHIDSELAFEAAVVALWMKNNVSEADHPLVCEGIRRQRGELACALLVIFKDDQAKLDRIMDHLLDKNFQSYGRASLETVKEGPVSFCQPNIVVDLTPQYSNQGAHTCHLTSIPNSLHPKFSTLRLATDNNSEDSSTRER